MRLVSMVVEDYIEEGVHRYMMVVVDNHKEVHHNHCLGMHHRMALAHGIFGKVVAKKVDQILEAPHIFDCSILDACCHCNFHLLQYS
ncbi:hypothetical protein AHAS_Ahas18G0136600 [Arachis hypogaea]